MVSILDSILDIFFICAKIFAAYAVVCIVLFVLGFILALCKTAISSMFFQHRVLIARIKSAPLPSRRVDVLDEVDKAIGVVVKLCTLPVAIVPLIGRWCYYAYLRRRYKTLILTNPDPEIRKIAKKHNH